MIAIANDHSALEMKKEIMSLLDEMGLEYKDFGAYSSESCNYPVFGARAARAVASGECEFGILLCGTGLGIGWPPIKSRESAALPAPIRCRPSWAAATTTPTCCPWARASSGPSWPSALPVPS